VELDKGHPGATVTKILVAGTVAEYPTVPDGGSEPALAFHWQFYASFEGFPAQPVVLDISPDGLDGGTGTLMVSTQNSMRVTGEGRNLLVREVAILGLLSTGWSTWRSQKDSRAAGSTTRARDASGGRRSCRCGKMRVMWRTASPRTWTGGGLSLLLPTTASRPLG
jgi:hypothetical protein